MYLYRSLIRSLPIVTLPLTAFSSRVAASLNGRVGLGGLLNAESRRAYVEVAARLYHLKATRVHTDGRVSVSVSGMLGGVRDKIRAQLGVSIYNSSKFVGGLEKAYQTMFEIYYLQKRNLISTKYHLYSI